MRLVNSVLLCCGLYEPLLKIINAYGWESKLTEEWTEKLTVVHNEMKTFGTDWTPNMFHAAVLCKNRQQSLIFIMPGNPGKYFRFGNFWSQYFRPVSLAPHIYESKDRLSYLIYDWYFKLWKSAILEKPQQYRNVVIILYERFSIADRALVPSWIRVFDLGRYENMK